MKPWKAVSLILCALAVAAAGYGLILVRRGFSALATPSAIEVLAATTARKLAVPSSYRQLSERHGAFLPSLRPVPFK
jgi:hypothetical protein